MVKQDGIKFWDVNARLIMEASIFLRYATREDMVEKYGFASYTMIQNNIAEATHSFMKDNIQP